jgi:hypothetical protein
VLVVFKFIKLAFLALAIFAIYSATPEERIVMYEGAKAFGSSVVAMCTRPESPCTVGIAHAKRALVAMLKDAYPPDGTVVPGGDPYATSPRQSFDTRPDPNRDIYRR